MLKANFSSPKHDINSWHNPNQSPEQLPYRLFTGAALLGKRVRKVPLVMTFNYTSTLEAWIQIMTVWKQQCGTKNSGTAAPLKEMLDDLHQLKIKPTSAGMQCPSHQARGLCSHSERIRFEMISSNADKEDFVTGSELKGMIH